MQTQAIEDVESVPHFMGVNSHRKPLARAIGEMGFAMVYFELDPGESFSGGLHTHHDQEELFYVMEGTATFEVKDRPGAAPETYAVGPDEVIHFEKGGPYQTGRNETDGRIVAFAIGVPKDRHGWDGNEALFDCAECGRETVHDVGVDDPADERMPDPEEMRLTCVDCGTVVGP